MHPWPIDHVGIAVRSIQESAPVYERMTGASRSDPETLEEQGVHVVFVGSFELLEATSPASPIARFIERRAPGLHHIALRVPNVAEALREMTAQGHVPIDEQPRAGAGGHRVAFLHPSTVGGVLVELVERGPDSVSGA